MFKSNFDLVDENLSGGVLLYKISENLLESKPFKTSQERPYFLAKSALCMLNLCIYYKIILIQKNIRLHDVLKGLNLINKRIFYLPTLKVF